MKHQHIFQILLPLASAAAIVSCADDSLLDPAAVAGDSSFISFSPSTLAVSNDVTRGGEEKSLYDPLLLDADSGDFPIYLHTYEHPLEDEADSPATRGVPVTGNDSFLSIHGNFGIDAVSDADGVHYFGLDKALPVNATNSSFWTTETARRWPAEGNRLNFGAVAPWSHSAHLKSLTFDKNRISFAYSAMKDVPDFEGRDAEAQPDLMLASSSFTRKEAADYGHHVPLKFYHALSAVRFAVRDVLKGEVVSISVKGVYGTANCSFTADNEGTNGVASWSGHSDKTFYTQIFNEKIEGGDFDPSNSSNDRDLNPGREKTFMLIPQQIPEDAVIELVIRRDNVAPGVPEEITVRGNITKNNVKQWLPGHEYIYTISTSADNWVYVFDVTGNEAEGTDNIYVYSPSEPGFQTPENTGYYDVVSYRYKANNFGYKEALSWSADYAQGNSDSYQVSGNSWTLYEGKNISADDWITDNGSSPLAGLGSVDGEHHDLDFYPHYLATDWPGDKTMQLRGMYNDTNSKSKPWDLSKFGNKARTTANCYIVDRGGWYCFPLVYGNAVVNGAENSKSYTSQKSASTAIDGILKTFTDFEGRNITSSYISVPTNASASLVWQDAYNMVSRVELATVNGEKMIRFFVDKDNLQQGNAIIALMNGSGTIMWSWHIWATEHWLDSEGLPHAFSSSSEFNSSVNEKSGVREKGDATVDYLQHGRTFLMAPYNLGWCDAKNVIYLGRKDRLDFVQYMPDKTTPTKKSKSLDIIQNGSTVSYKIGNNTYYQFGRKDPQVGFVDYKQGKKVSFVDRKELNYRVESQKDKTLADGIQNPNVMYAGLGDPINKINLDCQDWTIHRYINLWNNSVDISGSGYTSDNDAAHLWSHLKTVYDPSPAGYMVPNAGVWRVLDKGIGWTGPTYYKKNANGTFVLDNKGNKIVERNYYHKNEFEGYIHGVISNTINDAPGLGVLHYYRIQGKEKSTSDDDALYLIPTGHRWYSNEHPFNETSEAGQNRDIKAGDNFNLRIFYAWSNHWSGTYNAYGAAIGIDKPLGNEYFFAAQFIGRRAMARPVRPIREP